jgi:hypothetical protein
MHRQEYPLGTISKSRFGDIARLFRDCDRAFEEVFARDLAKRYDEGGIDTFEFGFEIPPTVGEFFFCRVTVLRRSTPHTVGDSNFLAQDTGFVQRLIEDTSRTTDEGFALGILVFAGTLANEEEVDIARASTVDDLASRVDEVGTPLAVMHAETIHLLHTKPLGGSGLTLGFFSFVEELLATRASDEPRNANRFGSTTPFGRKGGHDLGGLLDLNTDSANEQVVTPDADPCARWESTVDREPTRQFFALELVGEWANKAVAVLKRNSNNRSVGVSCKLSEINNIEPCGRNTSD